MEGGGEEGSEEGDGEGGREGALTNRMCNKNSHLPKKLIFWVRLPFARTSCNRHAL